MDLTWSFKKFAGFFIKPDILVVLNRYSRSFCLTIIFIRRKVKRTATLSNIPKFKDIITIFNLKALKNQFKVIDIDYSVIWCCTVVCLLHQFYRYHIGSHKLSIQNVSIEFTITNLNKHATISVSWKPTQSEKEKVKTQWLLIFR